MSVGTRLILLPLLLCSALAFAQQKAEPPNSSRMYLDVVVTSKSGQPIPGLTQKDFTLFDNKAPQDITSFQALGGDHAPVEVVLLVDAVNTGYQSIAYTRGQIDKFLQANRGRLAYPTTLAILTDSAAQMQQGFSTDGNALSAALDRFAIGLRSINRSQGFYGASDRMGLSLRALLMLAQHLAPYRGRKIVLWISPGWPFFSGPHIDLDTKQQKQIFDNVVNLSTLLREARVTLYSIDPLGGADAGSMRNFYYQNFLKGLKKPDQAEYGDLALQVIATQSGGLALHSSNDITALLQTCMADTTAYYELSFTPQPGEPNEYHHLEVRTATPGLVVRTRDGYYSKP